MRTLTPSLLAHQAAARRRPAVRALLSRRRAASLLLAFGPPTALPGSEAPHALVVTAAGTAVQLVNDGGSLRARRDGGPWSPPLASLPPGAPVAAAAVPGEIAAAFADGTALRTIHSFDDGLSWSAPATRVTEAVPIGSLALAGRHSNGNLCAFYTLGVTPAVKRLRRTGGSWAASGTTWTMPGSWATVTGLAAVHAAGDFHLLVTGTAPGSGAAVAAAHVMGDGGLPSNAWFGPRPVAAADAASGIACERPSIAWAGQPVAAFREVRTAPVAGARVLLAQAVAGTLAPWAEPVPFAAGAPYGLALASDSAVLLAARVGELRSAPLADELDVSDRLARFRRVEGPAVSRALLELADPAAAAGSEPLLAPGAGIEIRLGYRSGPGGQPEYGPAFRGAIEAVELRRAGGVQAAVVRIAGPWERLAAYRAPATWQPPAGTARGELLTVLAARAGIPVASAADLPPSGAWTTEEAAFAIQAGEAALPAALRLLEPTPDAFRAEAGFEICGLTPSDPAAWLLGPGAHPLFDFVPAARALPAWARVQGPDRAADAFRGDALLRDGPALFPRRELGASTDPLAEAFAARLLARLRRGRPLARARLPFHAGLQLWDVVEVVHPLAPGGSARYRVVGIAAEFRAGAAFDTVLSLGEVN